MKKVSGQWSVVSGWLSKFAIVLAFLSVCFRLEAGTWYEVLVTVTNVPSAGDKITINSVDRTWTNNTASAPASLILIDAAGTGSSATNLFRQVTSYVPAGVQLVDMPATNQVRMLGSQGTVLTVTASGTWCTITTTTNTGDGRRNLSVPASLAPNATRTNDWTLAATALQDYAQSAISATATFLGNFVSLSQAQTITGQKTYSGGVIANSSLNFINGGALSNLVSDRVYWTNRSAYPGAIIANAHTLSPNASGHLSLRAIDGSGVPGSASDYTPALEEVLTPQIADHRYPTLAGNNSFPLTNTFGVVTITNQVGGTATGQTQSGPTITGDAAVSGQVRFLRSNNTTLANGGNTAIDFGSVVFVKIKAGPTGAFTIHGMQGGANGKILLLYNSTGQNMTIAHDSGTEPTPANRIYTNTGSDVATTGNGVVICIYDSEDSRWVLVSSAL